MITANVLAVFKLRGISLLAHIFKAASLRETELVLNKIKQMGKQMLRLQRQERGVAPTWRQTERRLEASFQLSLASHRTLQGLPGTPSKTPTTQKARAQCLQPPHSCQTWGTGSAWEKGSSCSALLLRPDVTVLPAIPAAPQRDAMGQLSPAQPRPLC